MNFCFAVLYHRRDPSYKIWYLCLILMILQELSCVPPNYMDNQQDLNERMRGILIDWLIEVDRSRQKLL